MLGQRIRTALKLSTLSQDALAERTGITQSTLSRIIRGQREASLVELAAISQATGVSLAFLRRELDLPVDTRVAARSSDGASMSALQDRISGCIALDRCLDEYGIE